MGKLGDMTVDLGAYRYIDGRHTLVQGLVENLLKLNYTLYDVSSGRAVCKEFADLVRQTTAVRRTHGACYCGSPNIAHHTISMLLRTLKCQTCASCVEHVAACRTVGSSLHAQRSQSTREDYAMVTTVCFGVTQGFLRVLLCLPQRST